MKRLYLLILLIASFFVNGQTPGGISGIQTEYWLKANKLMPVLPADGADVVQWNDLSGNSRNFVNLEANPFYPKFLKTSMNFHPSVDFYFLDSDDGGPSDVNNRRRKLMTVNEFTADAAKSYFVIWVSKLDPNLALSAADATVFALNASSTSGNTNGNQYGWRTTSSTARLWHRTRGTDYLQNPIPPKEYGIAIAVLPNNTTTPQEIYLDALKSTTSMSGRILGVNSDKSVLGTTATDTGYENYFFGEVMEVIVMSKTGTGNTLSVEELKKINSYLGIKYGITLDKTAQPDYVLSDGTVIYNRNNSGYSNYSSDIVGLGRDDASGLYQKQALSTDNPGMGIYVGEFSETNDENTSVIADKSAIVFGSTGLDGSSSYNYGVGTQFSNYTFQSTTDPLSGVVTEERVNDLSRNIYRAKITGASSFVVNILPPVGQWVVVSNTSNFTPSNTTIHKVIGGVAQNVTINDGDYVGFVYYMRAPGGVTNGLRMWLNASQASTITTNSQGQVLTWVDYAGFGTTYRRRIANNESAQYVNADERTNYHPTLVFDSATDYLITDSGPMSVPNPLNSTFYTVVNHNFARDRSYFLGFGTQTPGGTNSRRPVYGVFRDGVQGRGRFRSAGEDNSTKRLFNPGATMIAGYHWTRGVSIEYEFDAYTETKSHTSVTSPQMNGVGMLGAGSLTDSYLLGTMPEVFAYEGTLNEDERRRINSYLGLKYAITLDLDKNGTGVNYDYKFSNGSMVWPGNNVTHSDYHNNIASLIRDDEADLNNRQSRSTDVGAIVHMGIGRKLGIDSDLDYILSDQTAITWGHNNGTLVPVSFQGDPDICGALDSAISGRVWLADNVNFSQDVLLAAHGEDFPYSGANYQVYLLIADSPTKFQNKNWDQAIPMAYQNDMHLVKYKFTSKYTYFTFAAKQVGGCEGCEFSGIKEFDFTRITWPTNGDKGPNTYNLGDNFFVKIEVLDPSNSLRNRYPRRSSQQTLREYRRGPGVVTNVISFQDQSGNKRAASTFFEVFDIDRIGNVLNNVQVIGYCNGSPVYPKMYYTYSKPERSRYTISGQGQANAKPRGALYNGNSGYTNKRGRVFVEFEQPVEEIRVLFNTIRNNNSMTSSYIGIGPMEFYCPAPLPAPNEDGLILTKQGPLEVKLCDVVDYTFRVVNTNCDEKEVVFSDLLPEGMTWVNDSFMSSGLEYNEVTGYGGRILNVTGLKVLGGGEMFTLRASAIFTSEAQAGIYNNKAKLNYSSLGVEAELESVDRLTGFGFTQTNALASSRLLPVQTRFYTDKTCFNLNGEIEVNLEITNPNSVSFTDLFLQSSYNADVFSLIANSIQTSTGLTLTPDTSEVGGVTFEGFTLPSGVSWLKFKIKASNVLNDYEIDPTTQNPIDVDFSFELFSEADQDCLESVFANANGDIEMEFCTVCYYAPITTGTTPSITNSNGFSAITSLNRSNSEWVTLRGNAFLVIESQNKGFVITRLTTTQINALQAVEGMLVYDTTVNCLKLYNGSSWGCLEQGCVDE